MEDVPKILEDTSNKVKAVVKKTGNFLNEEDELFEKTKLLANVVYGVTKLIEVDTNKLTMPELIIDNFDSEQVWAGVQMQNQENLIHSKQICCWLLQFNWTFSVLSSAGEAF